MLVNCDVKGLEVVVAAELSQDKVLCQEVRDGVDFHEENRKMLGFTERRDAKFFKFRLLYGTSAYGFTVDSLFTPISTSQKHWEGVIERYYEKYFGIRKWHNWLIDYAKRNQRLEIPSARFYPITPDFKKREPWPITVIKNYPVQGFGADLVMLARLRARQLLQKRAGLKSLLISTIHDSIVADCPANEVEVVGRILNQAVEDIPLLCRKTFGYDFKLPMTAEVQYGRNKKDMENLTFA